MFELRYALRLSYESLNRLNEIMALDWNSELNGFVRREIVAGVAAPRFPSMHRLRDYINHHPEIIKPKIEGDGEAAVFDVGAVLRAQVEKIAQNSKLMQELPLASAEYIIVQVRLPSATDSVYLNSEFLHIASI